MSTTTPDVLLTEQEYILRAKKEWEQTFDAVSDLIYIVDNNYTVVRANRAMADYFGLTPMDLVGRKCYEVVHCMDSVPDNCLHARLLDCGKPQTAEIESDKFSGIFEVTSSPIFDDDGKIIASVHVARDITEKKSREALLAAQQKQLMEINSTLESRIEKAIAEQRNRDEILIHQSRLTAMVEMISNIAHNWRQPINNVGLIVQSLQLGFKVNNLTTEEMNEDVAEILKELQLISENIDEFRNFFSHEEETSSFSVNEIVSRALSFLVPFLKSKGIKVELKEGPNVLAVGYPNEYMQAFLNIMLNAKDELRKHQDGNPLIMIRIFDENGHAVVTIRDNGGGISEDNLAKIFDPCFTTQRQSYGTGIGLYIAKMIVEKQMNGSLTVRNIDRGAEFRIVV